MVLTFRVDHLTGRGAPGCPGGSHTSGSISPRPITSSGADKASPGTVSQPRPAAVRRGGTGENSVSSASPSRPRRRQRRQPWTTAARRPRPRGPPTGTAALRTAPADVPGPPLARVRLMNAQPATTRRGTPPAARSQRRSGPPPRADPVVFLHPGCTACTRRILAGVLPRIKDPAAAQSSQRDGDISAASSYACDAAARNRCPV